MLKHLKHVLIIIFYTKFYCVGALKNGFAANRSQFPYMAAIVDNDKSYICSAAIVHVYYILTSADITLKMEKNMKHVIAGDVNLQAGTNSSDPLRQERNVVSIQRHHFYKPNDKSTAHFDLALVKVHEKWRFNENIAQIEMGMQSPKVNWICTFISWSNYDEQSKNVQLCSKMAVKCRIECDYKTPDTIVCAKSNESSVCRGDEGAPFVCENRIFGIYSKAPAACADKKSTRFANVGINQEWIATTILRTSIKSERNLRNISSDRNICEYLCIVYSAILLASVSALI